MDGKIYADRRGGRTEKSTHPKTDPKSDPLGWLVCGPFCHTLGDDLFVALTVVAPPPRSHAKLADGPNAVRVLAGTSPSASIRNSDGSS